MPGRQCHRSTGATVPDQLPRVCQDKSRVFLIQNSPRKLNSRPDLNAVAAENPVSPDAKVLYRLPEDNDDAGGSGQVLGDKDGHMRIGRSGCKWKP